MCAGCSGGFMLLAMVLLVAAIEGSRWGAVYTQVDRTASRSLFFSWSSL